MTKKIILLEIDEDVLDICIEAYYNGEKIEAIKTLVQEARKPFYKFGIKEAKEYLEKQKP